MMYCGVEMTLFSLQGRRYLRKKMLILDKTMISQPHHSSLRRYEMPLESDVEGLGLYTSNHHPDIRFILQIK